jgi:hypothetical protein
VTSAEGDAGDPEERLRSHAEAVVEWASMPGTERRDLVEELYSGLWERWHDMVDGGTEPEAAVQRAIRAFGTPSAVGGEVTLAYHSRLYASTVGVLLPPVIARTAHPIGLRRVSLLLISTAAFFLVGAGIAATQLPPTRLVVLTLVFVAVATLCLVALRALLHGQRWALAFARLCVPIAIAAWVIGILERPIRIDLLGVAGLLALWPVLGSGLSDWVAPSRPVGRVLGTGVAGVLLAGVGLSIGGISVPEITAAGPSDLHLDVAVNCTIDGGSVTELIVTAGVVFDRLDVMPRGIQPRERPLDQIAIWIDGEPAIGVVLEEVIHDGRQIFQVAWPGYEILDRTAGDVRFRGDLTLSDAQYGPARPAGAAVGAGLGPLIREDALQAGHRYEITWDNRTFGPGPIGKVRSVIVTYDHLGNFGSRAVVACNSSAAGTALTPPFLLP